ncbi:hypothetical protein [Ruminococcus sp.]|uniref:hypothetical protein n=1 Tax=Ruminococcus sp. TaxID=41978 RepID=UPI0025D8A22A|nr:hypothetical protein [Ruminococcus sp.]MCR4640233.1 hypothetical protein [Ruminococcus sp.]
MEKKKKIRRRFAPFSNTPVSIKNGALVIMMLLAVMTIWGSMVRTITLTQKVKYKQMEHTVVTASEQIVNLSVESAVSIAKNIYTNEAIYDFLNEQYSSEAEFYAASFPLQHNTALNIAETNIVKRCTIYTSNPTILAGGNIKKLESAVNDYWYKYFKELNKSTVLCIDQDKNEFILVRKLDYYNLDTGDSYLCLEMNNKVISEFADSLDFDGELYIMSGNHLLYTSDKDAFTSDSIAISQDFECITRNYYTLDIEFYSRSRKNTFMDFIKLNKQLMLLLAGIIVVSVIAGHMLSVGIKRRVKAASAEYKALGIIQHTSRGKNGRDEIGTLLDICCDMSDKLQQSGMEFKMRNASLLRKESDYSSLFKTAMRLDAELTMGEKYPNIKSNSNDEDISLTQEAELIEEIAGKFGTKFSASPIPPEKWHVPAYSFALIAADIFKHYNDVSSNILVTEDTAVISFESSDMPSTDDMLKLSAIFEDGNISDEYNFNRHYRFNPYLRLKHCLGERVGFEIPFRDRFRFVFTLKKDTD